MLEPIEKGIAPFFIGNPKRFIAATVASVIVTRLFC
jgi:hypothetical protein